MKMPPILSALLTRPTTGVLLFTYTQIYGRTWTSVTVDGRTEFSKD